MSPWIWVGQLISWDNAESKIRSQNCWETGETPDKVFQSISGMLKSPRRIRFVELILALLRKLNNFS